MTRDAIGLLEVRGWVAAIEAGDAMLKAARVRLLRGHSISPGRVTLMVEGDIASCRAAVDAGMAAVRRFGGPLAQHVIGRPEADTWHLAGPLLQGGAPRPSPASRMPGVPAVVGAGAAVAGPAGPGQDDLLAAVMRLLADAPRGRSLQELARELGQKSRPLRAVLERWVAASVLARSGARYLAPGVTDSGA